MKFINRIKSRIFHYTWDLAYGKYNESIIEKGLRKNDVRVVHNPYKDKWFADPFIYDEDDLYLHLFVEEFDKKVKRGRIAHIKIDKASNTIDSCNIILDLPTHLSFPAIYRVGDKVYVQPENFSSGCSYIYEYDKDSDSLVNQMMVVDMPLTDAVIHAVNNGYEMSATVGDDSNGSVLSIFKSMSFTGPYHVNGTMVFPNNSARMAGRFIETEDNIVRPAQNCNGDYGKAVWFYKDNTVVGKLLPWGKYDGLHTFNIFGDTFVIDLKKYDNVILYRVKELIKRLING